MELSYLYQVGNIVSEVPPVPVTRSSKFRLLAQRSTPVADRLADKLSDPTYEAPPCRIYDVGAAFIHQPSGLIVTADGRVITEAWQVAKHYLGPLGNSGPHIPDGPMAHIESTAERLEAPVFHCLHSSTGAYGHFVFDGLAAVSLVLDELKQAKMGLFLPATAGRWIPGRLSELKVPGLQTPGKGNWVRCDRLLTTDMIDTRNTFRPNPIVVSRMDGLAPAASFPIAKRLYIDRSRKHMSSQRSVRNEPAVRRLLVEMGFQCIEPAELTMPHQAAMFQEAECIIGQHGSAFGNLVFAKPGTKVIDIMPEGWVDFWPEGNPERWLLNLTSARQLDYTLVLCRSRTKSPDKTARHRGASITSVVDIRHLRRTLEMLLN